MCGTPVLHQIGDLGLWHKTFTYGHTVVSYPRGIGLLPLVCGRDVGGLCVSAGGIEWLTHDGVVFFLSVLFNWRTGRIREVERLPDQVCHAGSPQVSVLIQQW